MTTELTNQDYQGETVVLSCEGCGQSFSQEEGPLGVFVYCQPCRDLPFRFGEDDDEDERGLDGTDMLTDGWF